MKKEVAEKWSAALRSGQYPQTKSHLSVLDDKDTPCFCALGVLCEISGRGHWENNYEGETFVPGFLERVYISPPDESGRDWEDSELPECVKTWAGMSTCIGAFCANVPEELREYTAKAGRELEPCISVLNDYGMSFTEIASVIDEHWEQL